MSVFEQYNTQGSDPGYSNGVKVIKAETYIVTFASGSVYKGEVQFQQYQGKYGIRLTGNGILTIFNGDVAAGVFLNGGLDGIGTYVFANGDKYSGEWYNNAFHGQGELTSIIGVVKKGTWQNNIFRDGTIHQYGILLAAVKAEKEIPKN